MELSAVACVSLVPSVRCKLLRVLRSVHVLIDAYKYTWLTFSLLLVLPLWLCDVFTTLRLPPRCLFDFETIAALAQRQPILPNSLPSEVSRQLCQGTSRVVAVFLMPCALCLDVCFTLRASQLWLEDSPWCELFPKSQDCLVKTLAEWQLCS